MEQYTGIAFIVHTYDNEFVDIRSSIRFVLSIGS